MPGWLLVFDNANDPDDLARLQFIKALRDDTIPAAFGSQASHVYVTGDSAESTDFSQGHHVEYDQPAAVHYESDDYTNLNHDATSDDHVFAAEGSESSHQAEFSELDALRQQFDSAFASGTRPSYGHQSAMPSACPRGG